MQLVLFPERFTTNTDQTSWAEYVLRKEPLQLKRHALYEPYILYIYCGSENLNFPKKDDGPIFAWRGTKQIAFQKKAANYA